MISKGAGFMSSKYTTDPHSDKRNISKESFKMVKVLTSRDRKTGLGKNPDLGVGGPYSECLGNTQPGISVAFATGSLREPQSGRDGKEPPASQPALSQLRSLSSPKICILFSRYQSSGAQLKKKKLYCEQSEL